MSRPRSAFRSGVRDVLPANVPFGVIAGVATVAVGIDPAQVVAFAGLLFAGVVAWRTESMTATIAVRMVALWALEWLAVF